MCVKQLGKPRARSNLAPVVMISCRSVAEIKSYVGGGWKVSFLALWGGNLIEQHRLEVKIVLQQRLFISLATAPAMSSQERGLAGKEEGAMQH